MLSWLISLLLISSSPFQHDFHVSRCEVVYRPATKSFEITQHMFVDDIELALREGHEGVLNLCTESEDEAADDLVKQYVDKHFSLEIAGTVHEGTYLGKEAGEDPMSMFVFIEIANVPEFQELTVSYDLLFEVFDDQKNILLFQVDREKPQMFLLDRGKPSVTIARDE